MNSGKDKALRKLKTARGQIDGIIKMIEEDRYCIDVSTQILSTLGLLKKANLDILDGHLHTCVAEAIMEGEEEGNKKIQEIIYTIERFIK